MTLSEPLTTSTVSKQRRALPLCSHWSTQTRFALNAENLNSQRDQLQKNNTNATFGEDREKAERKKLLIRSLDVRWRRSHECYSRVSET